MSKCHIVGNHMLRLYYELLSCAVTDYAGTDFYLRDEGLIVSEKLATQTWEHCGCRLLLSRYPGHYLQLTIVKFHLGPIELCRYSHLKVSACADSESNVRGGQTLTTFFFILFFFS